MLEFLVINDSYYQQKNMGKEEPCLVLIEEKSLQLCLKTTMETKPTSSIISLKMYKNIPNLDAELTHNLLTSLQVFQFCITLIL